LLAPPRPSGFLGNRFALLKAQLFGTSESALPSAEFAEGDRRRILFAGRFLGRFLRMGVISQGFPRGLFHNGAGELADVGRSGFFA
jgi:hypothetical protein